MVSFPQRETGDLSSQGGILHSLHGQVQKKVLNNTILIKPQQIQAHDVLVIYASLSLNTTRSKTAVKNKNIKFLPHLKNSHKI